MKCGSGARGQNFGQTKQVLDSRFIWVAVALSLYGAFTYIRDTIRGVTSPNRVTWGLWGLEGLLAFAVEVQQHVGLAAIVTLMFGLVPCSVVVASFRNSHLAWKIGTFDIFCGAVSLVGIIFWGFIHQPTIALISFTVADQIAALPTLRKSWLAPSTETAQAFLMGVLNTGINILCLSKFTTAGALFPGCIFVVDLIIFVVIVGEIGPRFRGEKIVSY